MTEDVKFIMQTLINNGHQAYLVGGAVRDMFLKHTPKDYDIATNAIPNVVESLFEKTIPTGKQYGTITVMVDNIAYEVTTFRLESEYTDGRRPNVIKFSDNLLEDLSRRDFTMNAMAMDVNGNIIDPFDGRKDIENKTVKFVGNSSDRLEEDSLRAFRLIRFMSKYGFATSEDNLNAIYNLDISKLSIERIREELNKILISNNSKLGMLTLIKTGLINDIIPELIECNGFNQNNPNHHEDVLEHILSVVELVEPKLELRLAALFHDIGKPEVYSVDENGVGHFYAHHKSSSRICRDIMKRLKYSNKEIEYVSELVYYHMSRYEHLRTPSIKKFITKVGADKLDDLFKLQISDIQSSNNRDDISMVEILKEKCYTIINEQQPISIKDLDINGHDLMNLGYKGKDIGDKLKELLEIVLNDENKNTKEQLYQYC